jgi:radical SAM protein with 4Fe4S-binding SPASM domain
VYVATNGTLLPGDVDVFMRCVDRIELSIDSTDPAEYAKIRGSGSVDDVVRNLRYLCAARERYPDVLISINCVLLDGSGGSIEDLFSVAGDAGVDHMNFNVMQNWSVHGEVQEWTGGAFGATEMARSVEELSERFGVSATLHGPAGEYSDCVWARAGCFITWDGYVTPCCQRPNPDEVRFGNVFERGLEEIHGSRRYSAFREMLRGNRAPEECRGCSVYGGGRVEDGYPVFIES